MDDRADSPNDVGIPGPKRPSGVPGCASNTRLILKFCDDVELGEDTDVAALLDSSGALHWSQLSTEFPGIRIRRMFEALGPDRVRKLVARARRLDPGYEPPNFLNYVVVEVAAVIDLSPLVALVARLPWVDTAYVDPQGSEPEVDASDDEESANQGYLTGGGDGINAEAAWSYSGPSGERGGEGNGQHFVDLERGWTLDHEDLEGNDIDRLTDVGAILDGTRPHGTKVLGVVCARDNALGCVGITPQLKSVRVVSYHGATIAEAIFAAIDYLVSTDHQGFGDVFLIEAQLEEWVVGSTTYNKVPVELASANFKAIQLASALGITVVEAAGNGMHDLDTVPNHGGVLVLDRSRRDVFQESGALMVAASSRQAPHTPYPELGGPNRISNFGSRIDCYAWGEFVQTTNSTGQSPFTTHEYTDAFGGSSSAAAIVAGAALAVQGLAFANLGYRFSGYQLRAILGDGNLGTKSQDPTVDRIGVMPDLGKILSSDAMRLRPDIYIRDFVGDVGDPHSGAASKSPDIILTDGSETEAPDFLFGEGSGFENSEVLGSDVAIGRSSRVYVRVRNRGGQDAKDVQVKVWWSEPAMLPVPDLWKPIGETVIPDVPAGNVLTVSPAIAWGGDALPTEVGHYCFIAIIGNALDPAPERAEFDTWDRYVSFVRNNNNVAWRNFNVIDSDAVDSEGYVVLPFLACGAPDKARWMSIETEAWLPPGARVLLEMPAWLYASLPRPRPPVHSSRERRIRVHVCPHGLSSFGKVLFRRGLTLSLRLLIHVAPERRQWPYEICVRQRWKGEEIGRITWRLARRHERSRREIQGKRIDLTEGTD